MLGLSCFAFYFVLLALWMVQYRVYWSCQYTKQHNFWQLYTVHYSCLLAIYKKKKKNGIVLMQGYFNNCKKTYAYASSVIKT